MEKAVARGRGPAVALRCKRPIPRFVLQQQGLQSNRAIGLQRSSGFIITQSAAVLVCDLYNSHGGYFASVLPRQLKKLGYPATTDFIDAFAILPCNLELLLRMLAKSRKAHHTITTSSSHIW